MCFSSSVAGMVASHDADAVCYKIGYRSQDTTIAHFRSNLVENLKFFRKENENRLPVKLIYFRHDESGDSPAAKTIDSEREAMLAACREIEEGHEKIVQITIIIVERERFIRLFAGSNGDQCTNVPSGTVLDTFGAHLRHQQFYMVSQHAVEGVTRPTKYRIFMDDADHDIDDLQELVYFVSFVE